MQASLSVLIGPFAGQTIVMNEGILQIGRARDCHVRPKLPWISRHHCLLQLDTRTLRIRDLGSKNGTLVNGSPLGTDEATLLDGDIVWVGGMALKIELGCFANPVRSPFSETQAGYLAAFAKGGANSERQSPGY